MPPSPPAHPAPSSLPHLVTPTSNHTPIPISPSYSIPQDVSPPMSQVPLESNTSHQHPHQVLGCPPGSLNVEEKPRAMPMDKTGRMRSSLEQPLAPSSHLGRKGWMLAKQQKCVQMQKTSGDLVSRQTSTLRACGREGRMERHYQRAPKWGQGSLSQGAGSVTDPIRHGGPRKGGHGSRSRDF